MGATVTAPELGTSPSISVIRTLELTYTSDALEGNTLSRRETAVVIEKGLTVGGKSLREHLEATNRAQAIDFVTSLVERKTRTVTEQEILKLHELVLHGIDDANAGRYRDVAVRITGSMEVLPNPRKGGPIGGRGGTGGRVRPLMKIGQLAKAVGETVPTIRH
jgi:hypothetical protein